MNSGEAVRAHSPSSASIRTHWTSAYRGWQRLVWIVAQVGIILLCVFDLATDILTNRAWEHLVLDFFLGAVSSIAVVLFARTLAFQRLRHLEEADRSRHRMQLMQADADRARAELDRLRQGLTAEMDRQFREWSLSPSETDVARFLVKGLSLKEIAEVRGCSERTARHQALAVYQKAGISGRAELAAYFLEEWLAESAPQKTPPPLPAFSAGVDALR